MKNILCWSMGACLLLPVAASSQTIVGDVHTVHSNLSSRRVYMHLDGKPEFDGIGCVSYWTVNSMDDLDFKTYVLPLLLTARASQQQVRVTVDGCVGAYPRITAVDLNPRQ